MLRALLYALAVLHLGPGLAFAIVAFGCDGAAPWLGSLCGGDALATFAVLTVAGWAVMGVVAWAMWRRGARTAAGPGDGRRPRGPAPASRD